MAKLIKFVNSVLCEYVAKGEGGKNTLVNVYGGDVLVSTLPAQLQLGIYIEIVVDSDTLERIELDLKMDDTVFATVGAAIRHDNPPYSLGLPTANLAISSFEIGVDKDLVLEVIGRAKGYKPTKLLSKRILKNPAIPS
ncbi:hypothetical protein [Parvibaculum sp.]|uniref:hypothetical protein n=1 Tax=Parvibaculum sp. TaxID=2024848 RepID=UPI002FDAD6C9